MPLETLVGATWASVIGAASWTAGKAASTTTFKEWFTGCKTRLVAGRTRPGNHDLVKGIRTAHLCAMDNVARRHRALLDELEPTNQTGTDERPFARNLEAFLNERLTVVTDQGLDHDVLTIEDIERVLNDTVHPASVEGFDSRANLARDQASVAALTELEKDAGRSAPSLFRQVFNGDHGPGWYDTFSLFVTEQLKTNERFRSIFFAAEFVDIKRAIAALDDRVAEALKTSPQLGDFVEEVRGNFATVMRGLRSQGKRLRDVKDDTAAIRAVVERLPAELQLSRQDKDTLTAQLAAVQAELQSTVTLIAGFLETMVGGAVPPEQFAATLFKLAAEWKSAGQRLDALGTSQNLSPQIAVLRNKARQAYSEERFADVKVLLARIEEIEKAALDRLLEHETEVSAEIQLRREGLAETKSAQASLAILQLDAIGAARLVAESISFRHQDAAARFEALLSRQNDYYVEGRDKGINFSLEIAIELARLCVAAARGADQHGAAQNNLGTALTTLGERESGTARLDEAITTYREALKERTRERVPLNWAMTQNNLGSALQTLGARESSTTRLDEAVAAFREALKEYTRECVPLDWAMTQNNLGNALAALGVRESGTTRLEEAVAAFREALKEYTRERVPLDWAMTQNNLGNALQILGGRESSTAYLDEAVAAFREALKERTRERVPLRWAMTQNNLGNALQALGARESGAARLEEAVAAYREALREWTRERVPPQWAMTQNNLGAALTTLGERESGTARLEEAIAAFREALKERTRERTPYDWAQTHENMAIAYLALARRNRRRTDGHMALKAVDGALEVYRAGDAEYDVGTAENLRGQITALLAELPPEG
jgi:tetratricopeptide (TPR) repeat protein